MRATLKAYILPDLRIDFIMSKKDLLANKWVESKHLHGFDPTVINAVNNDRVISKYVTETYGTYKLHDHSPEEILLRNRGTPTEREQKAQLFQVAALLDKGWIEDLYKDFSLGTPEERMKDESAEYFGDDDEDEDYDEGELPAPAGSASLRSKTAELNKRYKHLFSRTLSKAPAKLPPFKFDIDEEKWFAEKEMRGVRSQSQPKQRAIRDYLSDGMQILVELSEATKTSQVNMVPKAVPGEWRLTCDYRKLNECCKKIAFPLPKIDEILAKIATSKSRFFAKVDLTQGFHQVPLAEDHRIFSAFKTYMGTYQYLRMPMGIKGAPQYFQMCMTKVLEGLEDKCQTYIDDILIHGKTEAELIDNLEKVYERLSKVGLTANPKKTLIGMEKLDYLGYTINQEGQLLVNEEGRRKIFDFPRPVYKKQMKSFVGLVNVVQSRIPDCATLMKPLNAMIGAYDRARAGEKLIWTESAERSFLALKEAVDKLPTLRMMRDGLRTVLRTDASDYGVGGHLVQIESSIIDGVETETEHTIMFVSKAFDKTQLNWCTAEKECYAVWYACTKLIYLLEGTEFEVQVDHKNLTILRESENGKVRRWKNFLQRFDIVKWLYIPGPTNQIADALSRVVEIPEENAQTITENEILFALMQEISVEPTIQSQQTSASRANPGRGSHCETWLSPLQASVVEGAAWEDALMLFDLTAEEEQRIDPQHKVILHKLLHKVHNATEGHLGTAKTLHLLQEFIKERNQSPEPMEFIPYTTLCWVVKDYIKRCGICQKQSEGITKLYIEPFVGSTYAPMERVQLDHIGPFPVDAYGNKHILVLVDTFTRWVELYAVKDVTSKTTAYHLCDYILRYGPPKELYSDNGAAFIDATYNDLAELTGMIINHPKAGDKERTAIVERENKEVRRHLNNMMNELFMNDRWSFATKLVQRILNNTEHTSTGYAPAKLMYGKVINSILEPWKDKETEKGNKAYSDWIKEKIDAQNKIMKYMKEKMTYKDQINLQKRAVPDKDILYAQDYVLYRNMNKNKQQLQWIGPYQVTNREGDFYQLSSLTKDRKPFFAHARNLKRYYLQDGVDPVQIALMDKNEYLIEAIVDYKPGRGDPADKNDYTFAVLFKGYPDEQHWMTYQEVEHEEEFVKWCYGGHRPYTIGWVSANCKAIHKELIEELDKVESKRIADKKIANQKAKAANNIDENTETAAKPHNQTRAQRSRRNKKK